MELWKNLKEPKGRICVIDVGISFIEPGIGLIIVGYIGRMGLIKLWMGQMELGMGLMELGG